MLLFAPWRKEIEQRVPEKMRRYVVGGVWIGFAVCLWVGMPRYRINSGDRVRLLYLDDEGKPKHTPIMQYALNTVLPEAEIMNIASRSLATFGFVSKYIGVGGSMVNQIKGERSKGMAGNFRKPYRLLGGDNPASGVYPQLFNDMFGTHYRAAYLITPKRFNGHTAYPLVVFCHGMMGNWQLYQGIWRELDGCFVLSIGTRGIDGIFSQQDIEEIFTFYMPALERMGYNIDRSQLHLMGLSNGGTAVNAALHSAHAKDFRSLTSISANLGGLRKVACQVNLIGGGIDPSSNRMASQHRQLRGLGVKSEIYFDEQENHFMLVNKREEILEFLRTKVLQY